jgi:streptogramin lyase
MRSAWMLLASTTILIAGCSATQIATRTPVSTPSEPVAAKATPVKGLVHGGQQAIGGAEIFMYAVSTGGYNQPSTSRMLSTGPDVHLDSASGNYYVQTQPDGSFIIGSADYQCGVGTSDQVYLYSLGGMTGSNATSVNPMAGLMAVLGTCTNSSFTGLSGLVEMNEVTTVAAAYALAGFATDPTHISASSTAPIANAAASAGNLASLFTFVGQTNALATTPAGNGKVPQAEINTLADILAACINSFDPTYNTGQQPANACMRLFTDTGVTNPLPDTAMAAINIAHNPSANVGDLFTLAVGAPPFQTTLPIAPNDWTIAITYTGNSIGGSEYTAVDSSGNVWTTNDSNNTISEFSTVGSPTLTTGGEGQVIVPQGIGMDTQGYIWVVDFGSPAGIAEFDASGSIFSSNEYPENGSGQGASFIAIDGGNNIWVSNYGNGTLSEFDTMGNDKLDLSTGASQPTGPQGVALDGLGNIWVANYGSSTVSSFKTSPTVSLTGEYSDGGLNGPVGIAVDGQNNVWVTNILGANLTEFPLGVGTSGNSVTGGGLSAPSAVAIDGSGNVWVANQTNPGSLSEFTGAGVAVSPSGGYTGVGTAANSYGPVLTDAWSIAIDGSGNVWVTDVSISSSTNDDLVEFVGAAAPVVTPLSVAVKNAQLGALP